MVTIVFPSWAGFLTLVCLVVFFVCCVYVGRPQYPRGLNEPRFMVEIERVELEAEAEELRRQADAMREEREALHASRAWLEAQAREVEQRFGLYRREPPLFPAVSPALIAALGEIYETAEDGWRDRELDDGEDEAQV